MLGLGLAIDYSLFMVSRFREQLGTGVDVQEAVRQTVRSAGRTVMFSSITVAISLATLLVFPLPFLRSFAYAGLAVAVVAALASLVLLPAVLSLLGKRVNAWALTRKPIEPSHSKFWGRVAAFVMQNPWPVIVVATLALLAVAYPFLSINLGQVDERTLPPGNSVRLVQDQVRNNFSSKESGMLTIVSTTVDSPKLTDYIARLRALPNVDSVNAGAIPGTGTIISIVPTVDPISTAGEQLVTDVRAIQAPIPVLVGGQAASLVDTKTEIISNLPMALLLIGITTFVLLFLMFGSLLVPIKALVINSLSLSATFGAMVWIFQDGNLSGLLKFTPTGMLDSTMPILMFCVAFGLSMDYEVFLLSRIKEHYDKTGDNRESVAAGLEKTGGIVSAAAVSISVIFFAFATSGVMLIKLIGLGLALAVLLDAFIIRGTLVPAFMRLAGDANWWLPKPLRVIYEKLKISESE